MSQNIKRQAFSLGFDWVTMLASQIVDFGATTVSKSSAKAESKSQKTLPKNPFQNFNFKFDKFSKIIESVKKHPIRISLATVLVIFAVLLIVKISATDKSTLPLVSGSKTNFSPSEQITLNRKFNVPIRTSKGETTGNNLEFAFTTLDRSKRILIQGKPATARDTKIFVILNMEIQNSTNDQLTVKPVDLIRMIDAEGKSFAPDVHNKEVKVEPISIKKTRVGFVVDDSQNNFKFTFGEVNGPKETIEVTI